MLCFVTGWSQERHLKALLAKSALSMGSLQIPMKSNAL